MQDTLVVLLMHSKSCRMNTTIERNVCVAFCQIRVYCVEGQFFGQCMNSDPGSSLRSGRNASVKIQKLFVNRQLNCSLWESEPNSEWIYFVGECS